MHVPKALLHVLHIRQRGDGDCLAACASMVLAYLNHPATYRELLRELKVKSYGAPASNIRMLTRWNLTVTYSIADMTGLETLLQAGHPVIVFVRTTDTTSSLPIIPSCAIRHASTAIGINASARPAKRAYVSTISPAKISDMKPQLLAWTRVSTGVLINSAAGHPRQSPVPMIMPTMR